MTQPRYREYRPDPPLDALVECVWFLSQGAGGAVDEARDAGGRTQDADDVQRIPPDGCVEIIVHVGERFEQLSESGRRPQPDAMVIGVWTRPIAIVAPERFDTIGVRIRPGCASAFSPAPMHLFTDAVTDASAVFGSEIAAVRQRLGEAAMRARLGRTTVRERLGEAAVHPRRADGSEASSCNGDSLACDRERVAIVSEFLRKGMRERHPAVARSVGLILSARGRGSIDALARAAGIGHRRLERAFRTHVGVPAKTLSRIVRFQQVLQRSTPDSAGAWADLAAACGYTDQSHLIRDFAQFTGTTPIQLATAAPELADYFRRR